MATKIPKRYTLGEEIFSSVTHGVGSLLSVAGTVVLIVFAAIYSDAWSVVGCAVFGASLIILYCMSTLYHAITNPRAKSFFRIMDHNTIFFLIAGTYTPITISILRGTIGWVLFGIVWGAAVIGIRDGLGYYHCHPPSAEGHERVEPLAARRRRCVLYGWRYLLRNKEGEIFSFRLAHFHRCRKRLPLLFRSVRRY